MLSQHKNNEQLIRLLLRKVLFKEYITPKDLKSVENYADDLFSDVGVDVEFTQHFLDRVNDERNKQDITPEELKWLYQKAYDKYANQISKLSPGKEAVLSDLDTQINIPFAMNWDGKSPDVDMVGKTVMRKKDFKSYNPKLTLEDEKLNTKIKLKNILDFPSEISDIFNICKNEIELSNNDISITELYSKIYSDCLMQYHNLTDRTVDIIKTVRETIHKNNTADEVKKQYKIITNPKHIFSSILLRMLSSYKKLKFSHGKFENYRVIDVIIELVKNELTGKSHYSKSYKSDLLRSKVEINEQKIRKHIKKILQESSASEEKQGISPIKKELKFTEESRGSHHKQHDLTAYAILDGIVVGYVEYSIFQNEIHIEMVEVVEELKRQGIATKLFHFIRLKNSGMKIIPGYSTEEGSKFYDAYKSKKLPEDINVPINVGDEILGGRFKNHKITVKKIGKNDKDDITVNNKPLLKFRIPKK